MFQKRGVGLAAVMPEELLYDSLPGKIGTGMEAGADVYMTKPYNSEDLLKKIQGLL